MQQFVYVLRRKQGLSLEEFQTYWREKHGPLVVSHAKTLGIQRYVQVHSIPRERPTHPIRGQMFEPYDGVAELWTDRSLAEGTEEEIESARRALVRGYVLRIADGGSKRGKTSAGIL